MLRYRELLDAETRRAPDLIRSFQVTADPLVLLERVVAGRDRVSMADGPGWR